MPCSSSWRAGRCSSWARSWPRRRCCGLIGRGDRHPGARPARLHRRRPLHGAAALVPAGPGLLDPRLAARQQLRADADASLQGLDERLDEIYERHERKVTVIGWSLGGIYARMLARRRPDAGPPGDHARQPVPHGGGRPLERRPALEVARAPLPAGRLDEPLPADEDQQAPAGRAVDRHLLAAPTASCSGTRASSGPATMRENIEVRGSHSGLGWNPAVLVAIADRLAQPEGTWRPFRPPFGSWHLYPRPDVYRAA